MGFSSQTSIRGNETFVINDGDGSTFCICCGDEHGANAERVVGMLNGLSCPASLERTVDAAITLAAREREQARLPEVGDYFGSIVGDLATVRAKLMRLGEITEQAAADRAFLEPLESDSG